MSTLVVTDLDRTLVYSVAAFALDVPDAQAPTLVTAEFHAGRPLSYLTARAAAQLAATPPGVLVPATTRTVEQYRRITLPGVAGRYAVTTNGAHLLVDGAVDETWAAAVRRSLSGSAALDEVLGHLGGFAGASWVRTVRDADGVFCYLVCEDGGPPDGFVDELVEWCTPRHWRISVQGRKVYTLPGELRKSTAVQRVRELTGADRLLAAGDGILDADVLELADAGIRPRHGELEEQGWQREHVAVTERVGILAGEEIVRWWTDRLD